MPCVACYHSMMPVYGGIYALVKSSCNCCQGGYKCCPADLLPDGALDASIWKDWTAAISAQTRAKGKALFMPLRLALWDAGRA